MKDKKTNKLLSSESYKTDWLWLTTLKSQNDTKKKIVFHIHDTDMDQTYRKFHTKH